MSSGYRLIFRSSGLITRTLKPINHHPRCLSNYARLVQRLQVPPITIRLATGCYRSFPTGSRGLSSTSATRPYVDPKLSYAYGRSNDTFLFTTVSKEFERQTRETPDEVVFISHYENKQVTYRELREDVDRLSKALLTKFGVKKGDPVGVYAYNCYLWLVVQFAVARIGAILTPINPSYKTNELSYVLKKGKVTCLFMPGPASPHSKLNNHLEMLQADEIMGLSKTGELSLRNVILLDHENEYTITDKISKGDSGNLHIDVKLDNCKFHNWSETQKGDAQIFNSIQEAEDAGVSEKEACIINPDSLSPDDLFAIYYTSGTTGRPKGASLTHFSLINNVRFCQSRLRLGKPQNWKSIALTPLPLFHIFAGVLLALSPIVSSTRLVLSGYSYNIKSLTDAIIEHGANMIIVTPTILIDLLAHIESNRITGLPIRIIQSGGAYLQPEVASRCFKLLPQLEELTTGYGSTETGAVITYQSIHEPAEMRTRTVGPPIDFVEVRIVEPKTAKILPLMAQGEIQSRGRNVMREYLEQPVETAEVLTQDGWYKTGDIGFMHPYGSISISGRIKNMIIKAGENIYPGEVEKLIYELDFVESVYVVGVPDKRYGEQVCAWIKLKPEYTPVDDERLERKATEITKEDIIEFCKKNITYFKVPKYILFVDEFPMTATKKVQGHKMLEISIEKLNLHEHLSN